MYQYWKSISGSYTSEFEKEILKVYFKYTFEFDNKYLYKFWKPTSTISQKTYKSKKPASKILLN